MEINDYLDILYKVIFQDHKHPHYAQKEVLRKWNLAIATGEYQKEMIVRWRQKETKEQKEQRVRVYNSRTPQVWNKTRSYFYEVHRTEDFKEELEYKGEDEDNRDSKTKVIEARKKFYGNLSVREYLHNRQIDRNFLDPNDWLVVEWKNDGTESEGNYDFFPFEASSQNVLDFRYDYGDLEYIVIRKKINILEGEEKKDGWKYTLYGKNWSIDAFKDEVGIKYEQDLSKAATHVGKEGRYKYITYNNQLDEVQAYPYGYINHPEYGEWVKVTPLYVSKTNIDRLIQRTSTLDISIACHGFLQKFIYANPCNYSTEDEDHGYLSCEDGHLGNDKCPKCHGSGMQIHASDQDVVYLPLPDGDTQVIPLSNLVYYANIDKAMVDLQRTEVDDAMRDCLSTIFNENVFQKSEVVTTATENMLNWRSVNNTLSPYADHDAAMYEFVIRIIAKVKKVYGEIVHSYVYPSDYHLESLNEMMMIRKAAIDSHAPHAILMNIDVQIMRKQVKDDSSRVLNWQAFQKFKPFSDLSESDKLLAISSLPPNHPAVVRFYNFRTITVELNEEYPDFYALGYDGQRRLLETKTNEMLSREDAIVPTPINDRFNES